jgi:bifunctional non-homologous end joining protein LigD
MPSKVLTEIDGQRLKLSSLGKMLYPGVGITKATLIQYYLDVAPYILPYLSGRPLTLIRYPDGVENDRFYSKNKPAWTPVWMPSVSISTSDDDAKDYITADNRAALAWLGNLAALELHTMQVSRSAVRYPDHIIFDLDPPKDHVDWQELVRVATSLRDFLYQQGYTSFVKTSGSKGLHLYVPIVANQETAVVYETSKRLAQQYVKSHGKHTTLHLRKDRRKGRVLVDVLRNNYLATCVAPLSPRGNTEAAVSMPLDWDSLYTTTSSKAYTILNAADHLRRAGNPWRDWRDAARDLNPPIVVNTVQAAPTPIMVEASLSFTAPMLADVTDSIPTSDDYIYEVKWDGIRSIITKDNDKVTIYSRSGNDITRQFPEIAAALLTQINASKLVLDGELVQLGAAGKPQFSEVVGRLHIKSAAQIKRRSRQSPATLYLFDILHRDGEDLTAMTQTSRSEILASITTSDERVRISEVVKDGKALLDAVKQLGLEGIMCKDVNAPYEIGIRSRAWLKLKTRHEDTPWIIGYTKGKGGRTGLIGALHLGKIVDGNLIYMGKVGTGMDTATLKMLTQRLGDLSTTDPPVRADISEPSRTIWITPTYQCTITYASISSTGTYREPVFIKLDLD